MSVYHKHVASALVFSVLTLAAYSVTADVFFVCKADEVYDKGSFTHVRCSNSIAVGGNRIRYIAISNSDPQELKRFQDLGAQAVAFGRVDFVAEIADPATNIGGCNPIDCREAKRFGIRRQ